MPESENENSNDQLKRKGPLKLKGDWTARLVVIHVIHHQGCEMPHLKKKHEKAQHSPLYLMNIHVQNKMHVFITE